MKEVQNLACLQTDVENTKYNYTNHKIGTVLNDEYEKRGRIQIDDRWVSNLDPSFIDAM